MAHFVWLQKFYDFKMNAYGCRLIKMNSLTYRNISYTILNNCQNTNSEFGVTSTIEGNRLANVEWSVGNIINRVFIVVVDEYLLGVSSYRIIIHASIRATLWHHSVQTCSWRKNKITFPTGILDNDNEMVEYIRGCTINSSGKDFSITRL